MEIITGRLISKGVIKNLVSVLPKNHLKKVKKIIVTTIPDKRIRVKYKSWGGLFGSTNYEKREVYIYLYSIAENTNRDFKNHNNNWYHLAMNRLAETLYWQMSLLIKQNREFAWLYSTRNLYEAERMGILKIPKFRKIRFLKMWRDKLMDWAMDNLRRDEEFDRGWLPYVDHIRKSKIGLEYKYNLSQLLGVLFEDFKGEHIVRNEVEELYKGVHLGDNIKDDLEWMETKMNYNSNRSKFQRRVLKLVKPKFYVSKKGRKYSFFNDEHLERVREDLKWKPEIKIYYIG